MLAVLYSALVTAAAVLPVVASPPALGYTVGQPSAKTDGSDNYHITLTITNKGNVTAKLLTDPRGTLSTLPTNAFKIVHDESKESPEFWGAAVKYSPEFAAKTGEDDAFTVLKPGESFSITHDLSKSYDFSTSGQGGYTIEPSAKFFYVEDGTPLEVRAPGQKLQITVNNASDLTRELEDDEDIELAHGSGPEARDLAARATFARCTTARSNAIKGAIGPARNYAYNAYQKLSGNSLRYRTWFGAYNNNRRITVRNHYAWIYNTGFSNFAYDCSCTDSGTFAYVYPDRPTRIYLCGAFWRAPNTGTDSKAGTLVHESSHFNKHGGTNDYVYGQSGAKALARQNPARAIFNADSHEYFAENTPNIS